MGIQKQMTTFPSLDACESPEVDSAPPSPVLKGARSSDGRASFSDELRDELEALQGKYAELECSHSVLAEELETCSSRIEKLDQEAAESKSDNQELRSQLRSTDARADDLQIDMESAQQQLEAREDEMKQLRKQMNDKKSQNDNQALLDELDVLRDKLVNAHKNEVLLTKAKKRLEEMSQLPTEIKSLEEQNAVLLREASAAAGKA